MVKGIRIHAAERAERRRYRVEELHDAAQIEALLEPRRLYAAYAVGQLDPELIGLIDCWRAADEAGGEGAFVMYSRGGLGDAMFCMGDPGALEAILALHQGPRQNYATCEPRHVETMSRFFALASERPMLRMAVTAHAFRAPPPASGAFVRRLTGGDARTLNRLYNSEGSPTYYSGKQIDEGRYFGVFAQDRLVAVAGTHVVSQTEGIAVVGNVFTHPGWRGRGYATLATGATTAHLLGYCRDVVLTVDPENTPAVRAYQRLGYETICRLVEAAVTRRELLGLGSYFRRLRARLRGGSGAEIVVRSRIQREPLVQPLGRGTAKESA
jgi:RimJ/RimL family protein N-acetyltransferase